MMAPHGTRSGTLTPKQEAVALALASGHTIRQAAGLCCAGERTIKRWLTDPAFRRRVTELQAEAVKRATATMGDTMTEAADVLRQLLAARSERVRLGAARSLLELGVKLRGNVELEGRITTLES